MASFLRSAIEKGIAKELQKTIQVCRAKFGVKCEPALDQTSEKDAGAEKEECFQEVSSASSIATTTPEKITTPTSRFQAARLKAQAAKEATAMKEAAAEGTVTTSDEVGEQVNLESGSVGVAKAMDNDDHKSGVVSRVRQESMLKAQQEAAAEAAILKEEEAAAAEEIAMLKADRLRAETQAEEAARLKLEYEAAAIAARRKAEQEAVVEMERMHVAQEASMQEPVLREGKYLVISDKVCEAEPLNPGSIEPSSITRELLSQIATEQAKHQLVHNATLRHEQ